jgi:L-cystine uptake protein TcyP (sodium:dicarboxylate symporter family)
MSRFVLANLVAGFLAIAIGFGGFAGIPGQAVFAARIVAALCLLLLVSYLISNISPAARIRKRTPRNHRPHPRAPR